MQRGSLMNPNHTLTQAIYAIQKLTGYKLKGKLIGTIHHPSPPRKSTDKSPSANRPHNLVLFLRERVMGRVSLLLPQRVFRQ